MEHSTKIQPVKCIAKGYSKGLLDVEGIVNGKIKFQKLPKYRMILVILADIVDLLVILVVDVETVLEIALFDLVI